MKVKILRKLLVILIIFAPVISYTGCKKQAKCGCDGDLLFSLTKAAAYVSFNETGTTITFTPVDNPYAYYNFCNPGEMFPKLSESKSGDILLVSGHAFWECNYLYQSSNSGYQTSYVKVYMMQVTNVETDDYGKK
jgi:hypothetical protein